MVKNLRRTYDNPLCGTLYRYSSAASKYCGRGCRDKVYRERKAEKDKAAREARWCQAPRVRAPGWTRRLNRQPD